MADFDQARTLIKEFKGETYLYGWSILNQAGQLMSGLGKRVGFIRDLFPESSPFIQIIKESLEGANLEILGEIDGARPNAPREDLDRITRVVMDLNPEILMSFGGGSTIDAVKAAGVLCSLGGEIDQYFGTGLVSKALEESGKEQIPHIAIQTASSSSAHLTKYSNITDLKTGQKKLIVDDAIVPIRSMFDYEVTFSAPLSLTVDGALDGIASSLEVLYGAVGKPYYSLAREIAYIGIELVVEHLPGVLENPKDAIGREALGLATDLGGYAIMINGTNGGHLTSFSLVDILSHGRACAIMNPYYTVFFAPAIQEPLKLVGGILQKFGYTNAAIDDLHGRRLGETVAEGMIAFQTSVGLPKTLSEVSGFDRAHIERALTAAKSPQLKMKLDNMPVPLKANMIDEYMGSVLLAAQTGDLKTIKNVY